MENTLFDKYGLVFDSGKVIFKEDVEGDQMFIIQEGSVRISKNINGKEHILTVLGKGEFFGEMAIVNRIKRTATATAVGTVKLLSFDRAGFVGMIEKNAKIALNIIDKLCKRLQQANSQIKYLVKNDEKGLIALNLYYAFVEKDISEQLDSVKTVRELSLNLEIPHDVVLGHIKRFAEAGYIVLGGNSISVSNLSGLARLAGKNG